MCKRPRKKLILAKKNNCLPKVVIPVHLAGQSCDMAEIHALSIKYQFKIIEDASHAIGAKYQARLWVVANTLTLPFLAFTQ